MTVCRSKESDDSYLNDFQTREHCVEACAYLLGEVPISMSGLKWADNANFTLLIKKL